MAAALAWGALHALSPGHGKAMVAAYLAATHGTARHAVALGATVTVIHTAGVFALGAVTLLAAQYVLPERLYPWLNLVSGLLVLAVGAALLRSRVRRAGRSGAQVRGGRAHGHSHGHVHDHASPADRPRDSHSTWREVLGLGASAGLLPCPSALVVLLSALSQNQVGIGLLLIASFSLGLATALTAIALAVVYAGRLTPRLPVPGRLAAAAPVVSTVAILAIGVLITARALPQVA
jgi:ABC-type nickel/cobalt efflux system permease component RcnA